MTYPTLQDKISYVLANGYTKKSLATKMGYKVSTPISRVENGGKPFQGFEEKLDRIICEIESNRRGEIEKRFVDNKPETQLEEYWNREIEDEFKPDMQAWGKMFSRMTKVIIVIIILSLTILAINSQWGLFLGLLVSPLVLVGIILFIVDESTNY